MRLNKTGLIVSLATNLKRNQNDVREVIDEYENIIYDILHDGGEVSLQGFGKFYTSKQSGRNVVHPKNHTTLWIPPRHYPRFAAGKTFKKQISKRRR